MRILIIIIIIIIIMMMIIIIIIIIKSKKRRNIEFCQALDNSVFLFLCFSFFFVSLFIILP